jgi:hypothetical protein
MHYHTQSLSNPFIPPAFADLARRQTGNGNRLSKGQAYRFQSALGGQLRDGPGPTGALACKKKKGPSDQLHGGQPVTLNELLDPRSISRYNLTFGGVGFPLYSLVIGSRLHSDYHDGEALVGVILH